MESAIVSLTFDDGLRCQFQQAVPVLTQYEFLATFFLIANRDATHERHGNEWWKIDWREDDIALLKQLVDDGHEIGSHSVTHDLTKMRSQPRAEVHESKRLIDEWLGTNVSSFCYPYYKSHAYLAEEVQHAGYKQARGGGTAPLYYAGASYYSVPYDSAMDRFNIDCRQIAEVENVGGWAKPGCWHVLTFHGIGDRQSGFAHISKTAFEQQMLELSQLRDTGAVEIITFEGAANRMHPPASH